MSTGTNNSQAFSEVSEVTTLHIHYIHNSD